MNSLYRFCFLLLGLVLFTVPVLAQDSGTIITAHDHGKNITTVKVVPVKVSGDKDKYHSLQISPSFSYPGRQPRVPENIDFELLTVVKGKLHVDLYVVFIVDGETIFLSSSRSGNKRPVPGRPWMGERLVFRMPYSTLLRIAAANSVAVKLDAVEFKFSEEPMKAIRDFAKHIQSIKLFE